MKTRLFVAACLLAGMSPAFAQNADIATQARKNSAFCGYTFFTNSDDSLDFRGDEERRCFDMKGGDDMLILNRKTFPAGVEISTGTGRDTVWATDGPDKVIDPDGEDKDIRTYDGDDIIDIRIKVDKDPFRGVENSQRTTIQPGAGRNQVMLGRDLYSNAFARRGFNIEMVVADSAEDEIGGVCGRPVDERTYDLRTTEVPESASVSVNTFGCGIGLFGVFGDVTTSQIGGRLSLETSPGGYRVSRGDNTPRLTGEMRAGASLLLSLGSAHPDSDLRWEGPGGATIRSAVTGEGQGGKFEIRAGEDIFYQGDVTATDLAFDMATTGAMDVTLDSRELSTGQIFRLAATRMDITWAYHGGGAFPEIRNADPVSWEAMRYTQPKIDYESAVSTARRGGLVADPDQVVNPELPEDVKSNQPTFETLEVTPGNTRLTLVLRRENDRFGNCARFRVIDADGIKPDRVGECLDLAAPDRTMKIADAGEYERVIVNGLGMALDLDINGATGFRVNRLDIRY